MRCEYCKSEKVLIDTRWVTLDSLWGPLGYLMTLPKHQIYVCQDCGRDTSELFPDGSLGRLAKVLSHRMDDRKN